MLVAMYNSICEMKKEAPPPAADERFPGLRPGEYIRDVLDGCYRDLGYVSIIGVGKFYIPSNGSRMWDAIRLMVESVNECGYASLSHLTGWHSYFTSSHGGVAPKDSGYKFVGGPRELFRYIHGLGRTGMFRIEKRRKQR